MAELNLEPNVSSASSRLLHGEAMRMDVQIAQMETDLAVGDQ
jgi:hypothetical protein